MTYLSDLSFESIDEFIDMSIEKKVSDSNTWSLPTMESANIESDVVNWCRDHEQLSNIINGIRYRGGICRQDVESLESFRVRYDVLDSFMKRNPPAMYTAEPSKTLLTESMENFMVDGGKAIINAIIALSKWIWNLLAEGWKYLINIGSNNRKAGVKMDAYKAISQYINSVGVSISDIHQGKAAVKRIRDARIQDINKTIRQVDIEYLSHPKEYDTVIKLIADVVDNNFPVAINNANALMLAITKAKTTEDVVKIKATYGDAFKGTVDLDGVLSKVQLILKDVTLNKGNVSVYRGMAERGYTLVNFLGNLPILTMHGRGMIHPKRYDEIVVSEGEVFTNFTDQLNRLFDVDIPKMSKEAKAFANGLKDKGPDNPDVAQTLMDERIGEIVTQYQSNINVYNNLQRILGMMLNVRNESINLIVETGLTEVKALDEWISKNKGDLEVGTVIKRDKARQKVMDAVKSAHL